MSSIVVYFSHSGNTRSWAEKTASLLGSDLTEIRPRTLFPDDPGELERIIVNRKEKGQIAPVYPPDSMIDGYGVIILAFPIWMSAAPEEVRTYLSDIDWRGRKVYILATYSGAVGDYITGIKELCDGASFGRSCAVRTGCPGDSALARNDMKRYEEWIGEIKRFPGI